MITALLFTLAYFVFGVFWGRIFCRLVSQPGYPQASAFWASVFVWPFTLTIATLMLMSSNPKKELPGLRNGGSLPEWVFCQRPPRRERTEKTKKQLQKRVDELEKGLEL